MQSFDLSLHLSLLLSCNSVNQDSSRQRRKRISCKRNNIITVDSLAIALARLPSLPLIAVFANCIPLHWFIILVPRGEVVEGGPGTIDRSSNVNLGAK